MKPSSGVALHRLEYIILWLSRLHLGRIGKCNVMITADTPLFFKEEQCILLHTVAKGFKAGDMRASQARRVSVMPCATNIGVHNGHQG